MQSAGTKIVPQVIDALFIMKYTVSHEEITPYDSKKQEALGMIDIIANYPIGRRLIQKNDFSKFIHEKYEDSYFRTIPRTIPRTF